MAANVFDELWERTLVVLRESRSISELGERLDAIVECFDEPTKAHVDAAFVLRFLDERDPSAVAGQVERSLEEALERIAHTDPEARPLLALLRDA
jgi:hypothetical protein